MRLDAALKWLIAVTLLVGLLAGCGSPDLGRQYPLESVSGEGSSTSYVYRAAGETVPEVAARLAGEHTPKQISPQSDERMFLVYSDKWYHLQRDTAKPQDTLIEVSSTQYVRSNYSPSFLEAYLTAALIGELFDAAGRHGKYRGYTGRDVYKPATGSFRKPSEQDVRKAPPLTAPGKGYITKRGGSAKERPADSGGWLDRSRESRGTIKRGSQGSGSSPGKSWTSPRKKSPSTGFGKSGRIRRR